MTNTQILDFLKERFFEEYTFFNQEEADKAFEYFVAGANAGLSLTINAVNDK